MHCWLSPRSLVSVATYLFPCGVENILLTGLWYGKSKPHVPLISEHYTSKLFNMANGSNCNNETCELVSSVCRIQSVVPHLPAKALLLNIKQHNHDKFGYSMCKHPGRYTVILTGKYMQGCMNTGLLVLWLSEQRTKPGCLGELGRQEAPQCLALKEKMCFVNWLTFQMIYLLTECIVFAKASWKDSYFIPWFNPQYATESNSFLGISHELDNMFLSIKVPHECHVVLLN